MPKKPAKKDQLWFNNKYSNEENVDFVGSKKLNLGGVLKIEKFTKLTKVSLKKLQLEGLEIINCPQLERIELSELSKLSDLKVTNCPKLNNIIGLSKLDKLKSLSVTEVSNLEKLNCSSNISLTELEVNDLIELDCSNTSIERLSLNLCPNIKILNCSNNKKLVNLDVNNCSKLGFLDCTGNSKLTNLDLGGCPVDITVNPSNFPNTRKEGLRNLVIIGRTGGGKSTLSNVLTGTDEFVESSSSISVTKDFKKKLFIWKEKEYRLVDTIGVGDTKLSTKKVLYKILDGIYSMPEGISQVLFVVDGRFTAEEANTFKLFELFGGSVFGKGGKSKDAKDKDDKGKDILNYFTIVRTKFSNFKKKDECEKDRKNLLEENEIISNVVKSCRHIIYVNNPPVNIDIVDEDDKDMVDNNKKIRARSREILLDDLDKVCEGKYFKLKTWDELRNQIGEYIKNNRENLPAELENNEELQTLIKISQTFCTIS